MLTTLKNAFKIKEIRMKLLFTFAMLVVIRLGSQLPVPGVDRTYFARWFAAQSGDAFNFFDAFTGGSFLNMSIFALNITPYITSSIIWWSWRGCLIISRTVTGSSSGLRGL